MKKILLLFLLVFIGSGVQVWGQETIFNETLRNGVIPAGWTETDVIFTTDAGGYARFNSLNSALISPVLDLSDFANVQLSFSVAKFGAWLDGPITVEVSDDGGLTWTAQSFDSPIPTTSTYLTSGPTTITVSGNNIRIRFIRSGSPSEKRLRDVILVGDLIPNTDYIVDFERNGETKGFYASGTVKLSGLDWDMTDALIGTSENDWKNGNRSARLSGEAISSMTMMENKPNGIGNITFRYRRYGTDTQVEWMVEVSTNNGSSWIQVGDSFIAPNNDEVQNFSEEVNVTGNVRVRIKRTIETGTENRRLNIDDILITDFVECINPMGFFRTISDGIFQDGSIWEVSDDGNGDWQAAGCAPVYLQSAQISLYHNINKDKSTSIKNLYIFNGAQLIVSSGVLRINGSGESLTIANGGVLEFNGGEIPFLLSGAKVRVQSGGIVRVSQAKTGISVHLAGNLSLDRFIYENGSILNWNTTTAFTTSDSQVYFPDMGSDDIPVLRVSQNISGILGAGSPTTINGLLEANGNITWQNSGIKTFRNGITGTANVNQAASSGKLVIPGDNSILGGTGVLNLGPAGLEIAGNINLITDKTIAGGPLEILGLLDLGSYTLSLEGDLKISGEGLLETATSTVLFNGGTTQNVDIPGTVDFYNLTLTNLQGLNINNDLAVTNILTMSGGDVELGDKVFTLGNEFNTGNLVYGSGVIKGLFRRWIPGEITVDNIILPVGRGGSAVPVTIRYTTVPEAGTLTAEFITSKDDNYYGNLPVWDSDLKIDNLSDVGYWRLTPGNGLSGGIYDIRFELDDSFEEGLNNPDGIRILKRENDISPWAVAGDFDSADYDYIAHKDITTGFSEFAIGANSQDNPLPIELLSFSATFNDGVVLLNWTTASETANEWFTLERSSSLSEIDILGLLPGAGYSNHLLHYRFIDENPLSGVSYYRLKQTDYDGSYAHSDWVAVRSEKTVEDNLKILRIGQQDQSIVMVLQTRENSRLLIRATDLHGREIHMAQIASDNDLIRYSFVPAATGILVVTVSDSQSRVSARVVYTQR